MLLGAALAGAVTLASCLSSTTDVAGFVGFGGPLGVRSQSHEVRFEQNGKVVASTRSTQGSQAYRVSVPPGDYDVVVLTIPGGCPVSHVTVTGSQMKLNIICNLG